MERGLSLKAALYALTLEIEVRARREGELRLVTLTKFKRGIRHREALPCEGCARLNPQGRRALQGAVELSAELKGVLAVRSQLEARTPLSRRAPGAPLKGQRSEVTPRKGVDVELKVSSEQGEAERSP